MEAEYCREIDPSEPFNRSDFQKQVKETVVHPRDKILVLDVDGEIAGFLWLEEYDEEDGTTGYICDIHVDKKYRNKGFGKYMLATAEDHFKNRGIKRLQLEVAENNKPALNLYLKNGFELVRYPYNKNQYTPAGDYLEKKLT